MNEIAFTLFSDRHLQPSACSATDSKLDAFYSVEQWLLWFHMKRRRQRECNTTYLDVRLNNIIFHFESKHDQKSRDSLQDTNRKKAKENFYAKMKEIIIIWHTCEELAINWQLTPNDPEAFNYKISTDFFLQHWQFQGKGKMGEGEGGKKKIKIRDDKRSKKKKKLSYWNIFFIYYFCSPKKILSSKKVGWKRA